MFPAGSIYFLQSVGSLDTIEADDDGRRVSGGDGVPEHFLIQSFISGLRDDIRLDVKIKHPTTLTDTIGVARFIEERNQI